MGIVAIVLDTVLFVFVIPLLIALLAGGLYGSYGGRQSVPTEFGDNGRNL